MSKNSIPPKTLNRTKSVPMNLAKFNNNRPPVTTNRSLTAPVKYPEVTYSELFRTDEIEKLMAQVERLLRKNSISFDQYNNPNLEDGKERRLKSLSQNASRSPFQDNK